MKDTDGKIQQSTSENSGFCHVNTQVIPPKSITIQWFDKIIKDLKMSALQLTMAKILLKCNGRDAMLKYLNSIAQKKAV